MTPPDQVVPRVSDLGEFELIDRIAALAGTSDAVKGIGDDAAVIDQPGDEYLLATVDALVAGIHFVPSRTNGFDIGRRAAAVSMSDIAAMGGRPTFALVSLALDKDESVRFVEDVYRGLASECREYNTAIVGGNVTRTSGPFSIDVTLLGNVAKDQVLLRAGAQIGDTLAVTGSLGAPAAVRLLDQYPDISHALAGEWERQYAVPTPRIAAGRSLASRHLAHAALDISDGLSRDLRHLCSASVVGAIVNSQLLPISDVARAIAAALSLEPLDLALHGGEEYELLIALPHGAEAEAREALGDLPLTVIGSVAPPEHGMTLVGPDGRTRSLEPSGWEHF